MFLHQRARKFLFEFKIRAVHFDVIKIFIDLSATKLLLLLLFFALQIFSFYFTRNLTSLLRSAYTILSFFYRAGTVYERLKNIECNECA